MVLVTQLAAKQVETEQMVYTFQEWVIAAKEQAISFLEEVLIFMEDLQELLKSGLQFDLVQNILMSKNYFFILLVQRFDLHLKMIMILLHLLNYPLCVDSLVSHQSR